ncbi:MAG: ATP-dependent helicase HrpB [Rhodobacteraceae bacterium]|nr:MAG: ATP-dependent helicase HrpB [Paracoccaceae bacterium]
MRLPGPALPVDAALPALLAALGAGRNAVLEAPPGAGKTTRVPLALLGEPWAAGRIVMLEPRRLAARAAAARMAATLGEPVGLTVGFRIRGETRVSGATRIEVVTEGVLTRMLQADPGLDGVSAVIFDEIHERSLNADLGLAFCLESQAALRPDLRLIAMSATLDAGPLAALMGAARVVAEGRTFPVETRWAAQPVDTRTPAALAAAVADATLAALDADGDVLAFLPGVGEIARAAARLTPRLPGDVDLHTLHGDAPPGRQDAALAPAPKGRRKVVLATAVAETSLTVEGVRVVVDAGRARRARFDPGSGMTRLVTERVSRAEADQRRGRAGRQGPGVCFRLWTKAEEGGFPAFALPEIAVADLAPLALDVAAWGAADPAALPFLDPPPAAAYAEAQALLRALGALDGDDRATSRGRALAAAPVHPRLARMAADCAEADRPTAAALAGLLSDRDPLRGTGAGADVARRLAAYARPASAPEAAPEADRAALARARETARRLHPAGGAVDPEAAGRVLALAYPDRIAQRRPGPEPRYRLSGGKGARLDAGDALAALPFLVAADLDGDPREARIRLAAALTRDEAEAAVPTETVRLVGWDARARAVVARRERRLGALVVETTPLADVDPAETAAAMAEGVRTLGLDALPWTAAARSLRARLRWLASRRPDAESPDWSDAALLASLDDWLTPWLTGMRRAEDLARLDLAAVLRAALSREALALLDRAAPAALRTPAGPSAPIDYTADPPTAAVRPQWLFGLDAHPCVDGAPLRLDLVSPAGRPIAATSDLPGFWRGGWAETRKALRGRYPKHPWPEDPLAAPATTRAKPRA